LNAAPVEQIAPDLWRIRIPLPFRLREVNLYLLRGQAGYTLIDCGIDTPEARAVFDAALRSLGIAARDIDGVYVTHMHPDHIGMAGLRARDGARIFIMAEEERRARVVWGTQRLTTWIDYCALHGATGEVAEGIVDAIDRLRSYVLLPQDFEHIADGDMISAGDRRLRVVWTPGHSDFHYVLVDDERRVVFCGDQLLPSITPNIGLYPECRPNPLEDFLWSLGRFEREAEYAVLPAHGETYQSLPRRVAEFRLHHRERLEGVLERVRVSKDRGTHAFAIVRHFWGDRLSPHEVRFALVEIVAHLEYLRARGAVEPERRAETQVYHLRS
jgi:glyoxylase-like metal-dependent hydrolase (beta-lactamase superfamily II)